MSDVPPGRPTPRRDPAAGSFVPPSPPPMLAYAKPVRRRRPWIVRKWTLVREEAGIMLALLPAILLITLFFFRWGLGLFLIFSRAMR